MTAGLTSRSITGTKVALAPAAFVGLLATALLAGGLLGVATKSELDSINANQAVAQVAAPASGAASRRLVERNAQIVVGRGPLVRDLGPSAARPQAATHVADHIGLTERLFPVTATHVADHIGLTERLFPGTATHSLEP